MKTGRSSRKLRKTGMVAIVTGAAITCLATVGCDQRAEEAVAALASAPQVETGGQLPGADKVERFMLRSVNHAETFLTAAC